MKWRQNTCARRFHSRYGQLGAAANRVQEEILRPPCRSGIGDKSVSPRQRMMQMPLQRPTGTSGPPEVQCFTDGAVLGQNRVDKRTVHIRLARIAVSDAPEQASQQGGVKLVSGLLDQREMKRQIRFAESRQTGSFSGHAGQGRAQTLPRTPPVFLGQHPDAFALDEHAQHHQLPIGVRIAPQGGVNPDRRGQGRRSRVHRDIASTSPTAGDQSPGFQGLQRLAHRGPAQIVVMRQTCFTGQLAAGRQLSGENRFFQTRRQRTA